MQTVNVFMLLFMFCFMHVYILFGRRSKSIANRPVNRVARGSSNPTQSFGHGSGKRKAKELVFGSQLPKLSGGGSKQRPKLAPARQKKKESKKLVLRELALQLHRPEKKHALLHPNPKDWFPSCII